MPHVMIRIVQSARTAAPVGALVGARGGVQAAFHVLIAVSLLMGVAPAAAQLCQVPLSIQKGDVDANIMILLDNSGSMNEAMEHDNYNEDIVYPGDFTLGSTYFVDPSSTFVVNDNSAYLVAAPNGQQGRYSGNYLNWIFYVATDEERAALPLVTKLDVAQTVVKAFIDRTDDVYLGLAKFNVDDGAVILSECGAPAATLKAQIDALAGDSNTPLAESMEDILDYFMRTDGGAPIQYDCQMSFLIVITDGLPTMDLDVSSYLVDADGDGNDPGDCTSISSPYDNIFQCSDHMDDVAYWARHNDLIDWLGEPGEPWEEGQTMATFTIGFDIDHPLLQETAYNGDGLYLSVNDAAELWSSLETVMVNIRQRVAAGAAVAVVSSESSDVDFLYRGKYKPGQWMGFVECFEQPYEDRERPAWEAGEILAQRTASSRDVFTSSASQLINFTPDNAGRLLDDLEVADVAEAEHLINWTLGDDREMFRNRDNGWKLGDIVHSAPVVVGSPTFYSDDLTYWDFLDDTGTREKILYVGANDGMLHAFRASDGVEAWAYVPEYALPMLKDIADSNYCHRFSVDLSPAVTDAIVDGDWMTVLISGAREGGPNYFAIDITATNRPAPLWDIALPDGLAYGSEVAFATLDGKDVVLIGSGVDLINGRSCVYEFDLETGELMGTLVLEPSGSGRNKTSTPTPVDLNFDGETDIAYVADLKGTVYRIEFNESTSPGSWNVTDLYSGSQPIQAQPKAAYGGEGMMCVYFGTGAYLDETDILTTDQMSFYCVFDRHDGNSNPDLVDQTNTTRDVGSADGWFIDLDQLPGERVSEPAVIAAETVFFTSYAPFAEPCRSGGESFFYRLVYDDGSARESDDGPGQRKFRGGGIASRPVLDIVNGTVIVQNSNQTITVEDIGVAYTTLTVKAWQEDFDEVQDQLATSDGDDDGDDNDND